MSTQQSGVGWKQHTEGGGPLAPAAPSSHMLQPLLFLCLVMTARMLASVAAVIASSCVKMMNCKRQRHRAAELWHSGS